MQTIDRIVTKSAWISIPVLFLWCLVGSAIGLYLAVYYNPLADWHHHPANLLFLLPLYACYHVWMSRRTMYWHGWMLAFSTSAIATASFYFLLLTSVGWLAEARIWINPFSPGFLVFFGGIPLLMVAYFSKKLAQEMKLRKIFITRGISY